MHDLDATLRQRIKAKTPVLWMLCKTKFAPDEEILVTQLSANIRQQIFSLNGINIRLPNLQQDGRVSTVLEPLRTATQHVQFHAFHVDLE